MKNIFMILLSLTVLFACSNSEDINYSQNESERIESIKTDTTKPVITTLYSSKIFPQLFEASFYKDTKAKQGSVTYSFYTYDIGKINIESGKIIACDPIVMQDGIPFTQDFPIGQFPVQLSMAKTYNDERVAFSRILFSDKPVVKWEFALQPGQKKIPIVDTAFYCYGVDAGTGLFIDENANKAFKNKNQSEWNAVFIGKITASNYKGIIHNFDGHNLATFSTGYGDGCYATYIGFDENEKVCRLITDFGLVEWWKLAKK